MIWFHVTHSSLSLSRRKNKINFTFMENYVSFKWINDVPWIHTFCIFTRKFFAVTKMEATETYIHWIEFITKNCFNAINYNDINIYVWQKRCKHHQVAIVNLARYQWLLCYVYFLCSFFVLLWIYGVSAKVHEYSITSVDKISISNKRKLSHVTRENATLFPKTRNTIELREQLCVRILGRYRPVCVVPQRHCAGP